MTDALPKKEAPEAPSGFLPMNYLSKVRVSSLLNPDSESMRRLDGVVNMLQDVVLMLGQEMFRFPTIVAVGEQGSGKSSVLEALLSKSFLPRGTGTVTRRPLVIHLVARRCANEVESDKVIFEHVETQFTDFNEVMTEIVDETNRAAGNNKGISPEPIVLTLYSTQVTTNLTIVDLPGIVKLPSGDQPEDVEILTRNIILKYITNPNSVILAVITANTDIATSESLKIAREVDPNGERTLAVVTKLDLMDSGTNALDILTGKVFSVKLGIVGIVSRSQKDIYQGKTLKDNTFAEINFFYKNYPQIAQKNGRSYLAKCLEVLLIERLRNYLPQLSSKIQTTLHHHRSQLKLLQGPKINSPNEALLQILTNFANYFTSQIRGQCKELDTKELKGGARISYVFHEVFGTALNKINPLEGYSRGAILTAVRNSAGAKPCIFVPESCFELLLKKQIARLEAPALRCVRLVYEEMEKMLSSCCNNPSIDMLRYPKLSQRIVDVCLNLLKSRIAETEHLVQSIIAIQGAYINTAHPEFNKLGCSSQTKDNQLVPIKEGMDEVPIVAIMEQLIVKYFSIVRKEVQDMVPKAIMYAFVNHVVEHIHSELVSQLYKTGTQNQELLEESITTVEQNKNTVRLIEALEKANKIISDIKEGSLLL